MTVSIQCLPDGKDQVIRVFSDSRVYTERIPLEAGPDAASRALSRLADQVCSEEERIPPWAVHG